MTRTGVALCQLAALASGVALAQEPPAHATFPDTVNWAYQLQDFDLDDLAGSRFNVLVIDYSTSGGAEGELTPGQVQALRTGPCGPRIVLAYFSIGEAESYRFYFDPAWLGSDDQPAPGAPSWLGPTNPEWEGNYKVRYWQKGWQRTLWGKRRGASKTYLDRVIDAGFDGVYLDIIDGFEYWGPEENDGNDERRDSARLMVKFVQRLGKYARKKRGVRDFLVVPQNGAGLLAEWSYPDSRDPAREAARQKRRYLKVVDGIGSEDNYYAGRRDEDNPRKRQKDIDELIELLAQFRDAGKPVLAIDYLTVRKTIDEFWRDAGDAGFHPYVSVRDLDRLTIPPGHAPTCDATSGRR